MAKKCPFCGCETFYVTTHVAQDWKVDSNGEFVKCMNECIEVTHFADDDDTWECTNCGYYDEGRNFNFKEENSMYIFEAIGMEEFVKQYPTKEDAIRDMEEYKLRFIKENDIDIRNVSLFSEEEDRMTYGDNEDYQVYLVYKKPVTTKERLMVEILRARCGLEQYSFELVDSYACGYYLDKLEEMIEKEVM